MRTTIRTAFAISYLVVGTVGLATLAILAVLLPVVGVRAAEFVVRSLWTRSMLWASGADLSIEGRETLRFDRPHVFVSNHQGMLDVVCLIWGIPVPVRFVAKHTIASVPIFGWYLKLAGYIFVDRSNRIAAVRSLDHAAARIRAGTNIVAFPEGTRTRTGRILPFKKGPFMLAIKSGVPIVPIAIEGSMKVMRKGSMRVTSCPVRLRFGEPIETAGLAEPARDALMRRVRDAIIDLHLAIGGLGGDREDAIAAAGVEGLGKAAATGSPSAGAARRPA